MFCFWNLGIFNQSFHFFPYFFSSRESPNLTWQSLRDFHYLELTSTHVPAWHPGWHPKFISWKKGRQKESRQNWSAKKKKNQENIFWKHLEIGPNFRKKLVWGQVSGTLKRRINFSGTILTSGYCTFCTFKSRPLEK